MTGEWGNPKFLKFKEYVLQGTVWDITDLYILINRVVHNDKKKYFGYGFNAQLSARCKYHKHWIRMLEGAGILEPIPLTQKWKVNREVLNRGFS